MEAFIICLVAIIGISFVIEMIIVQPIYTDVMKGFIPSGLSGDALYISIGIIGATVMPHNLYLHSSLVQTRQFDKNFLGMKRAIKFNFFDTVIALNLAFFVNAAILILAAAAFYVNGHYNIAEIEDASAMLNNMFGKSAPTFFAIALIAAGQSSTITGTLAGQIVMEGHLNLRIQPWLRRLITRLLAIVPAVFTILYFGSEALGKLLVLSQVVLSLQLGFAVIPLIHFTSDKMKMKEFVIKTWVKVLAWLSAAIIVYLNIQLVIQEIQTWATEAGDSKIWIYVTVIPIAIACFLLLCYVFIHPFFTKAKAEKDQLPHGKAANFTLDNMVSYSNIGVAIDFSGNEEKIIQNAIKQGGKEASYTFIHVVESAAARYLDVDSRDRETELDKLNLEKYAQALQKLGYTAFAEVGFGNPSAEIAKIIKAKEIDFLVLGTHGHTGLKDMALGTTIDALRHKIKIPLLIVN